MSRAAALAAVLVALSGVSAASSAKAPRWPWHGCVRKADRATIVHLRTADGVRLAGAIFGSGTRGVVLAHESDANLCNWVPYARRLAKAGYRALALDFRGTGLSQHVGYPKNLALEPDLAAATRELRRRGASSVVVVGASMGGAAAVQAGVRIAPPVNGVVALSAPVSFVRIQAEAEAQRLVVPTLYVAARGDLDYESQETRLFDATAAADKRLVLVDGGAHGTKMLASAPVFALVVEWLAAHSAA